MSQSKLVNVTILTNHIGYPDGKKGRGGAKIDKIFVHHMAGILTAKQCGNVFKSRPASAHYGIGSDGKIGQYVKEEDTAWHCASKSYNQRSIGIELSNDKGASGNWHVSDKTIAKCIDLIVDICKRNGIKKINYTGDLKGNLCMHRWTASTSCPGPYLSTKFKYIAEQANKKLGNNKPAPAEPLYRVRKTWKDAKSQIGAYRSLANAKKACKQGYHVFDDKGKVVYTPPAPKPPSKTKQDLMCEWAKKIAADGTYHYKRWSSKDVKTQQCPICKKLTGKYKGWNCIGFAWASWHHGGGLPSDCDCGVIANEIGDKMLKVKTDAEATKIAQKYAGIKDLKVIRNGGKVIPVKDLKKGDILLYFKGNTYIHTVLYLGSNKIAESNTTNPNIRYGAKLSPSYVKIAIRYIGK